MSVSHRTPSPHRARWALALGICAAAGALLVPGAGSADPETEARYPFDPACPWGRISNGKGMLNRCISETEAQKVLTDAKKAVPTTPSGAATGPSSGAITTGPAPAPEPPEGVSAGPVTVKLGALVADQGELGLGKLGKPLDRYAACVQDNGGLSGAKGSVTVQFLVRAEFVRAEGVEVKTSSGVSKKAARCIADVVDRRQVGAPAVPMTGATLTFEITPGKTP